MRKLFLSGLLVTTLVLLSIVNGHPMVAYADGADCPQADLQTWLTARADVKAQFNKLAAETQGIPTMDFIYQAMAITHQLEKVPYPPCLSEVADLTFQALTINISLASNYLAGNAERQTVLQAQLKALNARAAEALARAQLNLTSGGGAPLPVEAPPVVEPAPTAESVPTEPASRPEPTRQGGATATPQDSQLLPTNQPLKPTR